MPAIGIPPARSQRSSGAQWIVGRAPHDGSDAGLTSPAARELTEGTVRREGGRFRDDIGLYARDGLGGEPLDRLKLERIEEDTGHRSVPKDRGYFGAGGNAEFGERTEVVAVEVER